MTPPATAPLILHASAVAMFGRGLLIIGAAGSGKSSLALDLMSRGAALIADDRTCLVPERDALIAQAPDTIRGRIEARHIGILPADPAPPTRVALVVDLDRAPTERLPVARTVKIASHSLPAIDGKGVVTLAPALVQYLRAGRMAEG